MASASVVSEDESLRGSWLIHKVLAKAVTLLAFASVFVGLQGYHQLQAMSFRAPHQDAH